MKEGELGRIYANGEIIFAEGDKGEVMYVIQSGQVKVTKNTAKGEIELAVLGSGDILGEMALFDKLTRSATAVAVGEARILSVDKKKLFATISRDPTLAFKIIETMSHRIRKLNKDFSEFRKGKMFTDLKDTSQMILEEARNVIKADNGSIMLLDENNVLSITAAFGAEGSTKVKFNMGEGIAGDVLTTGKSELVNNVSVDSRFKSGEVNIVSLLCIPLSHGQTVFGVINLSNSSDTLFSLSDLKLLHSLASYAAMVLQSVRNFIHYRETAEEIFRHVALI